MGSVPMYNLTWGEYGTSLISAVQLLRCHGELVDVTLAAGGRTFHAHKVVLCAASPFLLDLLKSTTCKHPVVMLAGVQAADLEALLEFVYRGEVSIDQNQLPSLLQAAHCLNIQGLAPSPNPVQPGEYTNRQHIIKNLNNEGAAKSELIEAEVSAQNEEDVPAAKRRKKVKRSRSPLQHGEKLYSIQTSNPNESVEETSTNVNNAPLWAQEINIMNVATSTTMDSSSGQASMPSVQNATAAINNNSGGQSAVVHMSGTKIKGASDQPGVCPLCGAMLRQARNLRRHLVTSCKYRMFGGVPSQSPNTPTIHLSRELTPLQNLTVQNVERVSQNDTDSQIDGKPEEITPINCTELISPDPNNIIDPTTNAIQ